MNGDTHLESGHYTPIKSGNVDAQGNATDQGVGPVWYDPDLIGAGPDPSTANALLKDLLRPDSHGINLWVNDFRADFAVTGTNVQSHQRRDFFPRFFTQPTYRILGQCANNYEYNRLARYVRDSHINQVSGNPATELLEFTLEGDNTPVGRTTKGGNRRWKMRGYIKDIRAGADRFVQAPPFTFDFVLADIIEGVMRDLDELVRASASGYFDGMTKFLDQFGAPERYPNVKLDKPWGADGKKAKKPPVVEHHSDQGPTDGSNVYTPNFPDFTHSLLAGNDF